MGKKATLAELELYLDAHFIAEDRVIAAERALAIAEHAALKILDIKELASRESEIGPAEHKERWKTVGERLMWEMRDAHVLTEDARSKRNAASKKYCAAQAQFLDCINMLTGPPSGEEDAPL